MPNRNLLNDAVELCIRYQEMSAHFYADAMYGREHKMKSTVMAQENARASYDAMWERLERLI